MTTSPRVTRWPRFPLKCEWRRPAWALSLIVAVSVAAPFALAGCQPQPGGGGANRDPVAEAITATPGATVAAGGEVALEVSASDPDGDELSYTWSASGGAVDEAGPNATWTAPSVAGTYTVTCTISDGNGGSVAPSIGITVTGIGANRDPVAQAITAVPGQTVEPGVEVTLSIAVTDADGDTLTYAWACPSGSFTGEGATVGWTAPMVAGTYEVTCTVTDGKGGSAVRTLELTVTDAAVSAGHIVYALQDGTLYRIEATAGATPENLSQAMDALASATQEQWANLSPDGEWLLVQTDRFDADAIGWPGLAVLPVDVSSAESVRTPAGLVHAESQSAIASGGDLIVYVGTEGPHTLDLWATTRGATAWSDPVLLTGDSPYAFNSRPALSADGAMLLFDAGDEPFPRTAICEVGADGSGFRLILDVTDSPPGYPDTGGLLGPDYAPDGSIVFEADWNGEAIWQLRLGETVPVLVGVNETNDNSPVVLPDGRIVSLWLNRPENVGGFHELKVMEADGSGREMLLTGVDIADIGLGCGL